MTTKPTIILVHGFWGGAAHWSKVIIGLSKLGYDALHAVEIRSPRWPTMRRAPAR